MVYVEFLHPDLGIGGAERLIVDAAVALQMRGHKVKIYTAHHDKKHCFKETSDGTLSVIAVGDWLPRKIFGHLYAFCAYLRMMYAAMYCVLVSRSDPDIFVCDQVSVCVPILRYFGKKNVIFYCHFPDLLLTERHSVMKRIYRAPLDWLEEKTTGMADSVMVNSKFTSGIFHQTFRTLSRVSPVVVYPSLHFDSFNKEVDNSCLANLIPPSASWIFLSINRFERKKNLPLALKSFGILRDLISQDQWQKTHLIIAGGYDERVSENKDHYLELRKLSDEQKLADHVTFLRSFSDDQKFALLKCATCLLYTPSNEHFGIVPIESMYMCCPVVACNSGGPLETVKDGVTGYLSEPSPQSFSLAMKNFINNEKLHCTMGQAGRRHVVNNFSFEAFSDRLETAVGGDRDLSLVGIDESDRVKSLSSPGVTPTSKSSSWNVVLFVLVIVLGSIFFCFCMR